VPGAVRGDTHSAEVLLRELPRPRLARSPSCRRFVARRTLKAVQKLLGHASITTTADIYTDWDIDQLAETMRQVLAGEDDDQSFPPD
jgi:integrase